METASPNPFVSQNGSDLYCGGANGQHRPPPFDEDDFGPETDVDMVDDVLLSPAIAAAKALVHGKKELEDDLERQRQQMPDFDDPSDMDRSRDTPTPPAHEVASNANADNLAESGGEDSEEEWNYIPGKDTKPETDTQDENDMSSQLNPNAAEFVPVSPTRLLMLDDAIISAGLGYDKALDNSLDDIEIPTEREFASEIAHRPSDHGTTNGPHPRDDYFMRDNFSTLRNKGEPQVSVTNSELADATTEEPANIPFDQHIKNIEEKVTSGVLERANMLGNANDFSSNAFGGTNIFGGSDPMTTSFIESKDEASSPDLSDSVIPDTPKSTVVEPPASPTNDSTMDHHTLETHVDDFVGNTEKTPDLISPGEVSHDGLIGEERKSSSGFESESGAEEGDAHNTEESSEGFITEHRRSPPIDLSFKPIQTFSDTNPFGALQTPSSTTPLDHTAKEFSTGHLVSQFETSEDKKDIFTADTSPAVDKSAFKEEFAVEQTESLFTTPKKDNKDLFSADSNIFTQTTPSSFINYRSPVVEKPVPFDELESPKDVLDFVPSPQNVHENLLASAEAEHLKPSFDDTTLENKSNVSDNEQDVLSEEVGQEFGETKITSESPLPNDLKSPVDMDTTEGFLAVEAKVMQEELKSEQPNELKTPVNLDITEEHLNEGAVKSDNIEEPSKLVEERLTEISNEAALTAQNVEDLIPSDISPKTVEKVLAAFDDIKDEHDIETKSDGLEESKESDIEIETKEMRLEFESHIADSGNKPNELCNFESDFEIISKEELKVDEKNTPEGDVKDVKPTTLTQQTNPFVTEDHSPARDPFKTSGDVPAAVEAKVESDLMSAINSFNSAFEETLIKPEQSVDLSSQAGPVEPTATKKVSYQTLTPADEPKLTKTETYVTGIKEESLVPEIIDIGQSPVLEEQSLVGEPKHVVLDEPKVEEKPVVDEKPVVQNEKPTLEEQNIVEEKPKVESTSAPVEAKSPIVEETTLTKSEPVQSQVITETLITALEETSEVPSVTVTEVPSSTGTPPPTPAPGVESSEDTQKPDVLVAAVAAAGAVAAGTAVVAAKEVKKAAGPTKTTLAKKPDSAGKAPGKTVPASKAPASKPTTKTTTTKPATTATKPTTTTSAPKPTASKPSSAPAAARKPAAVPAPKSAPAAKTSTTAPKTAPAASSSTQKPVPKTIPLNKTSVSTLKPASKPTTPTSKPTTPTTPKSPSVGKTDVKSPPRPTARTSLTASKPASPATSRPSTGEAAVKKTATTTTAKPSSTTKPAPITKPASAGKTSSAVPPKAPPKPASAAAATTKTKTTTATSTTKTTTTTSVAKKPTPTATKLADKTVKDAANKQISSTKPAVNGKPAPAKTAGVKKTDPKMNGKTTTGKPAPIKKPVEAKKEEVKSPEIQEGNVTTTNGFAEHIIEEQNHTSTKIEELAPIMVEGLN